MVENGYGDARDAEYAEAGGAIEGAEPSRFRSGRRSAARRS